jgi:hypothetical protein
MQLQSPDELELVLNLVRFETRFLLTHFNELSQNIVTFGAMAGQLVICVSLKNVSTSLNQVSHYLEMSSMAC